MSNSYKIQAHFAKDSHYDGADSQVIVLKANRHKATAELPPPEHTTSQVEIMRIQSAVHKSNEQWNSTFGAID